MCPCLCVCPRTLGGCDAGVARRGRDRAACVSHCMMGRQCEMLWGHVVLAAAGYGTSLVPARWLLLYASRLLYKFGF